ncbi:MAG: G5 domain-containing protein [Coriobacteriales bacterium]|nr:G5 domain-containing protein [Coriobacteriales bacterium]
MRRRPGRPARSQKTQHIVAAFIPALIVVLSVTGFVWAHKPVEVVVDGRSTDLRTQARDVAGVLAELGVSTDSDDLVTPAPETRITPGMSVIVRHAVPVTVAMRGEMTQLSVIGKTVADALTAAGIDPSAHLAVTPTLTTPLEAGMTITAPDAFVRVEQQRRSLPFRTVVRNDPMRPIGQRAVVSKGERGTELRVWRVIVTGGKPGERMLTATSVVEPPKPRVVAVGTAGTIAQLVRVSRAQTASGTPPQGGRRIEMLCTGYTAGEAGVNHTTATGDRVGHGIIATDPDVIPMGTRLYVPGYGYGVAADVGGAIDGNHLDLYFDSFDEMDAWGSRTLTVVVLD